MPDVMASILKVWHGIGNQTKSIEEFLLEELSCQISSRFDLKRQSLEMFLKRSLQQEEQEEEQKDE